MNFKKITAIVCMLAILCTSAFAYTPFLPDDPAVKQEETQAEDTSSENDVSDENDNTDSSVEVKENHKAENAEESSKADKTDSAGETDSSDESSEEGGENTADGTEDGETEDGKTENGETKDNETEDSETEDGKTENGSGAKLPFPSSSGIYRPDNIYYELFRQIMDVYVENHLYEFSHEELMHKFFQDFLTDNPMYFKYFTNYLLGTMDPYSSYHDGDDGFLDGGSVSKGFGIMVGEDENGNVIIKKVFEDSNAHKAGLVAGDIFVSVMGFKVEDLPLEAVTSVVSDINRFIPEDQKSLPIEEVPFTFEFRRGDEIIPITMTKGVMVTELIDSYIEDNDGRTTGVITLSAFFGEGTDEKFVEIVNGFYNDGIQHLTIDLRDNGGGNLDYALKMVECFIPKDELICYYVDRTLDEPRGVYSTTDHVSFKSIAILVNGNTASAAELFSNILQAKGLAKLVGTTTYGKGIGQTVYSLVNGDYITITSYQILDQNLESYNEIGLKPDLEIENLERCYTLPSLGYFNHENYKEIKKGEYSEPAKALEDRLVIAGFLKEEYCDGVFDDTTERAVYALQIYLEVEPTGVLDDKTVSRITTLINTYKTHTYFEDSQFDVALFMHRSFSQGKRRLAEIASEAKDEQKKIRERDKALEDALNEQDKAVDTPSEAQKNNAESSENTAAENTNSENTDASSADTANETQEQAA